MRRVWANFTNEQIEFELRNINKKLKNLFEEDKTVSSRNWMVGIMNIYYNEYNVMHTMWWIQCDEYKAMNTMLLIHCYGYNAMNILWLCDS